MSAASTPPSPATSRRFGPAALATVTLALLVWRLAFNLGAYGEVFYEDVFTFVVASAVTAVLSMLVSPYEQRRRVMTSIVLTGPLLWLVGAALLFESTAQAASDSVFGWLGLLVVVVSVPVSMRLLVDLFVPDLAGVSDRRLLGYACTMIVLTGVVGWAVGANNDAFLLCSDFEVAGAQAPSNCNPG